MYLKSVLYDIMCRILKSDCAPETAGRDKRGEEGKLTVLVFSPREKLKLQALPWAGGTADLVFK